MKRPLLCFRFVYAYLIISASALLMILHTCYSFQYLQTYFAMSISIIIDYYYFSSSDLDDNIFIYLLVCLIIITTLYL